MPTSSETRDAILRSAREVFAEHGYQGASMRKIAARAGVTHAAIYRHFRDKDDLLSALATRDFEELVGEVGGRVDPTGSPLERLRTLLEGFVAVCTENPRLYEFLFQILPGLPARPMEVAETAHRSVVAVIEECLEAGLFDGDAALLADFVMISAHGYVARHLARSAAGIAMPDAAGYVDFVLSAARAGAVL